jgi:ATP-dependent Clp protease ATP-binding subunit ClpC
MAMARGFNEGFSDFTEFDCQAIPGPAMTDRARTVMVLAEGQVRRLGSDKVEPEHVLLALAEEGKGVAAHVLRELGIGSDELKHITHTIRYVQTSDRDAVGWSDATWRLLALAEHEAEKLSHHYIGTEHLLLAIAGVTDGVVGTAFEQWGIAPKKIRSEVYSLLGYSENE